MNAAGANISGMETGTGDTFIKFLCIYISICRLLFLKLRVDDGFLASVSAFPHFAQQVPLKGYSDEFAVDLAMSYSDGFTNITWF